MKFFDTEFSLFLVTLLKKTMSYDLMSFKLSFQILTKLNDYPKLKNGCFVSELTKANIKLESYRKMQKTQSDIVAKKEENVTSNQKKIDELELEISQKNAELTQLKEKNTNLTEDIKSCRSEIAKLNSELVEQSNLKQKELLIKSQCDDQVNFAMAQLKHKEDDVKVSIFYIADFNCSQSNFSNHAGHCYAIFLSTSFVISNCCLSDWVLSENERERQIF